MKTILILLVPALLMCNFACFTPGAKDNETGSSSGNTRNSDTTKPVKTDSIKTNTTLNKYTDLNKDAFALHYDAIVIDTHNDILMPVFLEG
ncbi:MAG TPA: hypothetical protein PKA39_12460, partial [Ignavibacteria bacterium]|nr:hypothetical protein [Ignavibacteria bacterium]